MSQPSYKLIYFNAKGRAEFIRILFSQAGVKFEDHRVQSPEWAKLKPTTPFGVLPVLEIDGVMLAESQAITRYLAREFGLAGNGNLEMARCEAVMEAMLDIQKALLPIFSEKDEAKKAELKKTTYAEKAKPKLTQLENVLIANGGDFFVGTKITMADIALFANIHFFHMLSDEPLKDFPKLTALKDKVAQEPKIAAWVAKRPDTPY